MNVYTAWGDSTTGTVRWGKCDVVPTFVSVHLARALVDGATRPYTSDDFPPPVDGFGEQVVITWRRQVKTITRMVVDGKWKEEEVESYNERYFQPGGKTSHRTILWSGPAARRLEEAEEILRGFAEAQGVGPGCVNVEGHWIGDLVWVSVV